MPPRAPRNGGESGAPAPDSAPPSYVLNERLSWPGPDGAEITALPGETRSDLPEQSVPWLLEQGRITPKKAAVRRDGSAE